MPSTSTVFSYSSAPQPIRPGKKYRNEDGVSLTLMSDPRVIRGSTNSAPATLKKSSTANGIATSGSRSSVLSKSNNQNSTPPNNQSTYVFQTKKYCNDELDLSTYLTEGAHKIPKSKTNDTQTDEFHRRPPTPEYIPRKTGIDSSTQIEGGVELFNFDEEVEPMLEIILKKTLEQALLEVCAEEEMKALGESVLRYEEAANLEKHWVKEKEKEAIDLIAMKDKDMETVRELNKEILITTTKVAGLQLMSQLMDGMIDNISSELLESGVWEDPVKVAIAVETAALVQESRTMLEAYTAAEEVTNELLQMAQERYSEMAAYCPKPRRSELTIYFQSDSTETDDSAVDMEMVVDEEQTDPNLVSTEDLKARTGSSSGSGDEDGLHRSSSDSAVLDTRKSVGPILVDEFDTIASVEMKIMAELRKKNMTDKKFKLYSYVVAALKGREFPLDACLLSFNLPAKLNIIV